MIHTVEGFGVVSKAEILLNHKKNETVPFAAAWTDLEIIILNETSQEEKGRYFMIPHMWNPRYDTNQLIYKTETNSQT